ncbi:MAG: hypothetical protein CMJ18_22835 [Phycisphaeraceae bacterium]|nr:hypothetical protein [Phycisphaeraceae bacterium]
MKYAREPDCRRAADSTCRPGGVVGDYLAAVSEQWVKPAPDANPAMLAMFDDRDRQPLRCMVSWAGEFAGKYLTHAVQIYRLTGDPDLRRRLERFVGELATRQDTDGYLGPWPKKNRLTGQAPNVQRPHRNPRKVSHWLEWNGQKWANYLTDPVRDRTGQTWDAWGHYHIMLGLLLWHETAGDRRAMSCARRIADLMCRMFLSPSRRLVATGRSEMNLAPAHSLAMLYCRTREKRYLDLALKIVNEFAQRERPDDPTSMAGDYFNAGLADVPFHQTPKPRWESLHPIMALAELHWITGNPDHRTAFENLWWSMIRTDRHNNGGFTSGEKAQGNPYDQGAIETCCTVAWIAMSVEMLKMTGSSIVADEIELSTLNSGLGLISQSGRWVTYDTPMDGVRIASAVRIVFQAREGTPELNCCSVNGPRTLGMIDDWAVMRAVDGAVIVNYFGPSEMTVPLDGGTKLTLSQDTRYPCGGRVELAVSPSRSAEFALKVRIPYWSPRTRVRLNGESIRNVVAGSYLVIDRRWRRGDRVRIDLDMSFHYWVGEKQCSGKASIYRGPILLTYDRRFNDMDPDDLPELNADGLSGRRIATSRMNPEPMLLMQFRGARGRTVRLCDFASAGETGTPYLSWLKVKGVSKTRFSRENPLRSGRAAARS